MTKEDQLLNRSEIIPSRTDVLSMAREAGIKGAAVGWNAWTVDLERFAALIASRVAAASASVEREACAKVCEELVPNSSLQSYAAGVWDVATFDCAAAIRARGQQ